MRNLTSPLSIRNLLLVDAVTCAAMGGALTLAAEPLMALTAIPAGLLFYAGALLLPIAAFMALVAMKPMGYQWAVWLVIGGNALWIAASLWLMFSGVITPNRLGHAFIGAQALAVTVLLVLEQAALQRASADAIAG
jgi:hypothetical protein